LGALFALLVAMNKSGRGGLRVLALICCLVLAAQSALTFSRGGLFTAVAAASLAFFFLLRERGSRVGVILSVVVVVGVSANIIFPKMDEFTDGALGNRFRDLNTTQRGLLARQDFEIWRSHPVLGVGPGGAKAYRKDVATAAHTEVSRLVAEHGTFGLMAFLMLLAMAFRRFHRAENPRSRAIIAALVFWSLFSTLHAAMRTVAPSFTFGLAFAQFLRSQPPHRPARRPAQSLGGSGEQGEAGNNTL
jgi:O-antigen ligase